VGAVWYTLHTLILFNRSCYGCGYTGGTFDVPHVGHANFLRQCKRIAGKKGKVVVALNSDDFVKEFKGKAPLFSFEERKALLANLEYVDEIVENIGGADSKPAILKAKPDMIVIGSDWAKKTIIHRCNLRRNGWINIILYFYMFHIQR
jgi:cytidyltransferase-like protein